MVCEGGHMMYLPKRKLIGTGCPVVKDYFGPGADRVVFWKDI